LLVASWKTRGKSPSLKVELELEADVCLEIEKEGGGG
jgi:hypothetical protein